MHNLILGFSKPRTNEPQSPGHHRRHQGSPKVHTRTLGPRGRAPGEATVNREDEEERHKQRQVLQDNHSPQPPRHSNRGDNPAKRKNKKSTHSPHTQRKEDSRTPQPDKNNTRRMKKEA